MATKFACGPRFRGTPGRPCAAIRALEQLSVELVFQIAQPPAEGRLAYVQRLSRLPQAPVLGRDDRPLQISKLDSHRGPVGRTHITGDDASWRWVPASDQPIVIR